LEATIEGEEGGVGLRQPDILRSEQSRWIETVLVVVGVIQLLGGLEMLLWPSFWYHTVPGVPQTGPLNAQIVRDGGTFNVAIGLGLILAARRPRRYLPLIAVAAGADLLHASLRLLSYMKGLMYGHATAEIIGVYIPTALLLAVVVALWREPQNAETARTARLEASR
jgi:hypothetical protein